MKKILKFILIIFMLLIIGAVVYVFLSSGAVELPEFPLGLASNDVDDLCEKINTSTPEYYYKSSDVFGTDLSGDLSNGEKYQYFGDACDAFLKKLKISATESEGNSSLNLSVSTLNYDDLLEKIASSDAAIRTDILNFKEIGLSEEEIIDYLYSIIVSFLDKEQSGLKYDTETVTVGVEDGKLSDNRFIVEYLDKYTHKFVKDLLDKIPETLVEKNQATEGSSFIKKSTNDVMNVMNLGISKDKRVKIALQVNSILLGDEAMKKLREQSEMNSGLALNSSQSLVFVTYNIINMDKVPFRTPDYFTYIDSDLVEWRASKFTPINVKPSAVIDPGRQVQLSKALIVPKDASCITWYDRITGNAYSFNIEG